MSKIEKEMNGWKNEPIYFIKNKEVSDSGKYLFRTWNDFVVCSAGLHIDKITFLAGHDVWHFCRTLNEIETNSGHEDDWDVFEATIGEVMIYLREGKAIEDVYPYGELNYFKEIIKRYKENEIYNLTRNYYSSYTKLKKIKELIKEETKSKSNNGGYVYFMKIKGQNLIKIGVSKRPPKRKAQLETKMPFEIEIINKIKCTNPYDLEKKYHERYKEKRVNGEWFGLSIEDMEYIKKL